METSFGEHGDFARHDRFLVVGHNTAEAVSGKHRQGCGILSDLCRFKEINKLQIPCIRTVSAVSSWCCCLACAIRMSCIMSKHHSGLSMAAVRLRGSAIQRKGCEEDQKKCESDSEWIHSLSFGPCCAVNLKILLGFYCKRWRRSHHARRRMSPSCRTMPTTTCPPPGSRSRKSS